MPNGKIGAYVLGAVFATILISVGVFLARSADPEVETVVRSASQREDRRHDRPLRVGSRSDSRTDLAIEDESSPGNSIRPGRRPLDLHPPPAQGEGVEEFGAGLPGRGAEGSVPGVEPPGAAAVGPGGVRAFGRRGPIGSDGTDAFTGEASDDPLRRGRVGGERIGDPDPEDPGSLRDRDGNIIGGSSRIGTGGETPAPTPGPTSVDATPTPIAATATPEATGIGTAAPTPTPTETVAVTGTPTETPLATPSPSLTPSPSPEPTETEEPEPTESPTPAPTATPAPSPSVSPSPSPSLSPSPSPSPHPGFASVYLEPGIVQVSPGQEFAVDLFVASQSKPVGGYRAHILWIPVSLQLVEVLEGSDPYLGYPTDATEGLGFLRLSAIQAQSLTAPVGILQVVTLRFRSLEPGAERIQLVNTGVANTDAQEMVLTSGGDEVQVLSVAPQNQRHGESDSSIQPAAPPDGPCGGRRRVPLDSLR